MVCQVSPSPAVSSLRSNLSVDCDSVVQKPPYSLSSTLTNAGESRFGKQRAIEPGLRRAAGMHALDHRAELRGHQAGGLGAGNAQRVHRLVDIQFQAARGAGGGGEHAQRRAGVPARGDVRGAHAQADARADFVAGDGGGQEFPAAHAGLQFGERDQRRQHHGADMQHAGAVHVVELEALHLGAVDERRVRRRELLARCPRRCTRASRRPSPACPAGCGSTRGRRRRARSRASRASAA